MDKDIVWFKEVDKDDVDTVGGKGANLGELYRAKISVPNGFIITAQAYFRNITKSGTMDRLRGFLFGLDTDDPVKLAQVAQKCQQEIKNIDIEPDLEKKIQIFYRELSDGPDAYVAVRSSATAEDLPQASFAGQQATFLNIKGKITLIEAVKDAWASLFEARAIFYRVQQKFDHFKVGIAIPVQKMIQSETSGVMFTLDPITNDKKKIIIEAVFGLGEMIVQGQVTPDHYEVDKKSFKIKSIKVESQDKQMIRSGKTNKILEVSKAYREKQKLPDEKITELARLGARIEKHYFFPQDIEWAYEDGQLYIVQTRPVTTISQESKVRSQESKDSSLTTHDSRLILQGSPASPVMATGPVIIIKSPKELFKIEKGDVLVTEMTNPDYVPAMKKAVAVVTDRGGRTSHAAIVSRELGIACVVGTGKATKVLKNGQIVTVDGAKGLIYKGKQLTQKTLSSGDKTALPHHKTATKLYVNLAEPELAEKIAGKNVDGVGLLRAEFILAQIGIHPKKFLKDNKADEFIDQLTNKLSVFGREFGNRPVIYRATDLKSNEYRNLKGGDAYEPKESNPMLGYRGAYRYIRDPDVFKMELEAIKKVRQKHDNLHLMIPFVRTVNELISVKKLVEESGLLKDPNFKFWMMAEIPANFILLPEFLKVGVDGVSIGSNDLTMLVLGTDRDNEEVASEFNELDPAVLWALEKIVKTCVKNRITCSICGQAPSIYPELTEKLVSWGITSISVNHDAIDRTREIIYEAEKKLVWPK